MAKKEISSSSVDQKLKVLDFFMIRSPSLSIEETNGFDGNLSQSEVLRDPRHPKSKIRSAVNIASPSLSTRLNGASPPTSKEAQKLLKYVKRMGRRCTPFGSFAGIAIAYWGTGTDLELSGDRLLRARMDMEWILSLVRNLEECIAVRRSLQWTKSSEISFSGNNAYVTVGARKSSQKNFAARVLVTPMLEAALEKTCNAVPYADLRLALLEVSSSKKLAAVDRFLDRLWSEGILVTDLQPPLTCAAPLEWIVQKLRDVPEATVVIHQLEALEGFVNECSDESLADYDRVLGQTRAYAASICPNAPRSDIQVDMALGLSGSTLCKRVRSDIELVAHTLLRISPMPFGPHYLHSFKRIFLEKYGESREVPLLDLLDPERGIGFRQEAALSTIPVERLFRRSETLGNIACRAIRDKHTRVVIDDSVLRSLELADQDQVQFPKSLELQIVVVAESNAMIDAGKYTVAVGSNVGAQTAGQHFGRFSNLIDPKQLSQIHSVAMPGSAIEIEDSVVSELTYMPTNAHYANVAIRERIAKYETAVGVTSGAPERTSIPPSELFVSIVDNIFRVRWAREDKKVRFISSHLLNPINAPPVVQFLNDIARDNVAQLAGFDWGETTKFEFLPRIEYGRLILSLARWRLSRSSVGDSMKSRDAFDKFFNKWVLAWDMPRHVLLSLGDNCLPIDVADSTAVDEVRKHLLQSPDGSCILLEHFPLDEGAWLRSRHGGTYHSELIVPLSRSEEVDVNSAPSISEKAWCGTHQECLHLPGSEWIFLKLYGLKSDQDDLIIGYLRQFCRELQNKYESVIWFFVRYADPDSHLRVRVKARSSVDGKRILEHSIGWAAGLAAERTILKFSVDSYERELHRYGGDVGTAYAEEFFFADSELVTHLLGTTDKERRLLAVLHTINCMLGCFNLTEGEILKWLRVNAGLRSQVGPDFRRRADIIKSALVSFDEFDEHFTQLLGRWQSCLLKVASVQRDRVGSDYSIPANSLIRSLAHMHCNRAGFDGESEGQIIALLARAREAVAALQSA